MKKYISIILLVVAAFLVNANSLSGDFVWDDVAVISQNNFVRSWNNFPLLFQRKYLTHSLEVGFNLGAYDLGSGETTYRPVATASYFFDYSLWKLNPFGYRLTDIILHIINSLLLYLLLNILFSNNKFAFLSALLFAIHPINAEVINCTAFRPNLLVFLFSMASILLNLKYRQGQNLKGRGLYLLLSLFSCLLALFSKEIAVILPLLLILSDYYKSSFDLKKIITRFGIYSLYFLLLVFYLWVCLFIMPAQQKIFFSLGLFKKISDMFFALGIYLKGFLIPIELLPLPAEIMDTSFNPVLYFGLAAVFVIVSIYTILNLRRFQKASFAVLWFFISLFPVNNFFYSLRIPVAYRYLYIPLAGLCVLLSLVLIKISQALSKLTKEKNLLSSFVIAGVLIYLSMLTLYANVNWKNDALLSRGLLDRYPQCYSVHANECFSLLALGDLGGAEKECNIALKQDRSNINPFVLARTYLSVGRIYTLNKKYAQAEEAYLAALKIYPNSAHVNVEVGVFYGRTEQYEKALEYFNKAKAINPRYTPAYIKSGISYMKLDKPAEAKKEWLRALEIYPFCLEAKVNLEELDAMESNPLKEKK
jgi:tetratricopeptide (TPR) repeat protein